MYDVNDIKPTALVLVLPFTHDAYGVELVTRIREASGFCVIYDTGLDATRTKHGIIFEYVGEGQACDAFVRVEEVLCSTFGEERLDMWDIDLKPYRGPLHTDVVS